jgi:hypothetical protein
VKELKRRELAKKIKRRIMMIMFELLKMLRLVFD